MANETNGAAEHYVDPMAYQKIVGSTFATAEHRPLVVIGNRSWNKWQLGRIGCPHPSAAVRVQRVVSALDIKTVKQFLELVPEFGRFKDLGVTSYWTALALAQDCGADIEHVHGSDKSFHSVHRTALKTQTERKHTRRRRG